MATPSPLTLQAAKAATTSEQETKVPGSLTLSQWILESGRGKHQPGNNCFGIKAYKGCFGVQKLMTHETINGKDTQVLLGFATFETIQDCFEKHAELLSIGKPYHQAWLNFLDSGDEDQLAREIAPIYATGPAYAKTILTLMHSDEVIDALAAAVLAEA
jgi:flagellum-specific peptidoglycan hydrolase FlgJ